MWYFPLAVACREPSTSDPADGVDPTTPVGPWTTPPGTTPPGTTGPTVGSDTVAFRVRSRNATRIEVWVYPAPTDAAAATIVPLTRSGDDLWSADVDRDALGGVYYGLRAWGPNWGWDPAWVPGSEAGFVADVDGAGNRFDPNKLLLDPGGREVSHDPGPDLGPYTTGDRRAEDTGPFAPKSVLVEPADPPSPGVARPPEDAVVYEVHVRGLTMLDPDVPEDLRGTYAGAALRAPALAALGVTAIELLPVHETINDQNDLTDDASGDNYWGYSTLGFFAPDRRYAADQGPGGPTAEFRAMVEAYHAVGVDVYLDVVYNHTAEGGTWGNADVAPLLSFRGVDNAAYYELSGVTGYRNDNGVGPNWNAVDPIGRDTVLDSLRYFATELGVDGFRFDLAPILGNGCATDCFSWEPDDPAGILARAADELDVVLIAEPWGTNGETYRAGQFPVGWSEWNDGYRDAIRADQNLLNVRDTTLRSVVDGLSGSPGRYDDGRPPSASVPYLVSHDGFTLADLYGCDASDNDQPWPYGPSGGGSNNNLSWDYNGDPVAQRRAARTGIGLLSVSAGIPMITGGDEVLRSQRCNNNPYNLDSVATWIDWAALDAENAAIREYTRKVLAFRGAHPALRPADWRDDTPGAMVLYEPGGAVASNGYLDDPTRHALAVWLDGAPAGDDANAILVLYNGWSDGVTFTLPGAPSGDRWRLASDSHEWLEGEDNALEVGQETPLPEDRYLLGARSIAVLVDP
ncbi:MAG: alpha-amylase family glycosyl hydrolase [Myxococcota bacterium]